MQSEQCLQPCSQHAVGLQLPGTTPCPALCTGTDFGSKSADSGPCQGTAASRMAPQILLEVYHKTACMG